MTIYNMENQEGIYFMNYYYSPTDDVEDILEFPHINLEIDLNNELVVFYCKVDEKIDEMLSLDNALLRLESECEAIHKFNQSIQTPEQKELAERLLLMHDGKKMSVDPASQDPDGCFGSLYHKDSKICNLSCGMLKDCIRGTKELKKKIREVFPTKYTTILKLLKEYGQENGI